MFRGDEPNLIKAKLKINEEFKNHKFIENESEIPELIAVAKEVELFYRTRVVQAVQVDEILEVNITKDTETLDNIPYKEDAVIIEKPNSSSSQCSNKKINKVNK